MRKIIINSHKESSFLSIDGSFLGYTNIWGKYEELEY